MTAIPRCMQQGLSYFAGNRYAVNLVSLRCHMLLKLFGITKLDYVDSAESCV